MRELFLFVRPPRMLWPFNGPTTAFWPPLAFASLAAALRESIPDIDVQILDCPATRTGWKSLAAEMTRRAARYVGIGEEAVSAGEGLRLARMAKGLGATVIAGGCTFGNLAAETLSTGAVDVVVKGEGERTIVEVVEALREARRDEALGRVRGIAFRREGETIVTEPRALIEDLDTLPMPAYDLLPVSEYGRGSRNHPDLATIEHGRGCLGGCGFCVLWRQMAAGSNGTLRPAYRTKSAGRTLDEIRVLTGRYGRRYLCWVDPCFNADGAFLDGLVAGTRREGIVVGQSAWVRADCIARDEKSGVLAGLVERGLNEIFVGVERADEEGLEALGRGGDGAAWGALPGLTRRFPSLYVVGSFIYGLEGDSWRTVKAMRDATIELGLDMAFYIPLTGLPGTGFWRGESWDERGEGLGRMDFLTPSGPEEERIRRLSRWLAASFFLDVRPRRVAYTLGTLFARDARKRRMNRRLVARGAAYALGLLGKSGGGAMVRPEWYDD